MRDGVLVDEGLGGVRLGDQGQRGPRKRHVVDSWASARTARTSMLRVHAHQRLSEKSHEIIKGAG